MGRVVVAVCAIVCCAIGAARADEPPPPLDSPSTPTGPSTPPAQPTTVVQPAPQATPVERPVGADGFTVDRHGPILLGGFSHVDGNTSEYGALYLPLSLAFAPRLKIRISGGIHYQRDLVPDASDFVAWSWYEQSNLQYDWRLPVYSRKGDFAVAAEGGEGVGQLWVRWPDGPFMPPQWEQMTGVRVSAAVALEFFAHNGFVVLVQPLGLNKAVYHSPLPGPMWSYDDEVIVELTIAAGYRWR